ncbi:MAG: type II secretion system protein [Armatimonadetes bacterium]|nr:type II secretion system protein [Armatimonadota bacterium]
MRRRAAGGKRDARGFSALELLGVLAVIAAVAGGLFVWGGYATGRARDMSCDSNLKQLGLALAMYADDHGGRLPASADAWPAITRAYTKNQQIVLCPLERSRPAQPPSGSSFAVSYFLVPGLASDDPPATIVAGDTEPRHGGRWNAVCLDGRIQTLSAAELEPYREYVVEGKTEDETATPGVHAD